MASVEIEERPAPEAKAPARLAHSGFNEAETRYMQGDTPPVTSSVLISNSKYLNSPLFREAYMHATMRRIGHDLPPTYHIPMMMRGIADVTDYREAAGLIAAEKTRNPDYAAWVDARTLTTYRPDMLRRYAAGTLGATIRSFIEDSGYDMEFVDKGVTPATDLEYVIKRIGANHDIEHMVTGFGPNAAGEEAMALMNVVSTGRFLSPEVAQFQTLSQVFVSVGGYSRAALHYPAVLPTFMEAMRRGLAAGLAIRMPLSMVRWEDYLDWPLTEIAGDLGFERGPGDEWGWTTAAAMG